MRLWAQERVEAAEARPEFTGRAAQAARRSAAGTQVARRKHDELLAEAASIVVRVPVMPWGRLVREACAHYNERQDARGQWDAWEATPQSDPEFLDRIMVNFLRHELTAYEAELAALYGKIGRADAGPVIRNRVLDAIAGAYPGLAGECSRQWRERSAQEQERAGYLAACRLPGSVRAVTR